LVSLEAGHCYLGTPYRKLFCADGPLILFIASLVLPGLWTALRSAAQSEAGASAQRKEPTNIVSILEGLLRAAAWPAGFGEPTALPGVAEPGGINQESGGDSSQAEHCLKFPGDLKGDKQC